MMKRILVLALLATAYTVLLIEIGMYGASAPRPPWERAHRWPPIEVNVLTGRPIAEEACPRGYERIYYLPTRDVESYRGEALILGPCVLR
jgi:hypothetical protein